MFFFHNSICINLSSCIDEIPYLNIWQRRSPLIDFCKQKKWLDTYNDKWYPFVINIGMIGYFAQCKTWNCMHYGGVMVSVLASSAVDRGFEPPSVQTKDYKIGICCFSAKHAALSRKSKDWLARNEDNVSKSGETSTRGLLFQWASTIKSN